MSRLATPSSIESSPAGSQPLLESVKKQLGSVPNLFRMMGNSPAALEGYLGLNGALGKGQLDAKTRARLAMVVAQANGCDYCLSAHAYLGKNFAKLDDAELQANREGGSSDVRASAAVAFAWSRNPHLASPTLPRGSRRQAALSGLGVGRAR